MSPLLRLAASMWFLIICPGMACVGLLDIADALPKYLLAIGFSLVIDMIVGGILVDAGAWQPAAALWILAGLTILGALAQTSLVPRGQGLGRVVEGLCVQLRSSERLVSAARAPALLP
jgi:hypothetical protein